MHSMFRSKLMRSLQNRQLTSRDAVLIALLSAYMGSNETESIALCADYCPYKGKLWLQHCRYDSFV